MTAHSTNLTSIGLQPGDKLDKYEVGEQIGAGGLSVVWKAFDRLLDQTVAVKQLVLDAGIDEDTFRERFRREAAIQKELSQANKNLVRVIDFVEDPRGLFIVMEYVDGPSLENMLSQNPGPVDLKTALGIAAAAAVALGAIHKQGVIHRDLKPANILLPKDGGLKICDFGLASLIADQETPAVGTVRYMSPELLNAQQSDARADMYSLGLILYEMLVGRQNFEDAFKIVLKDQRNQALRWMKWHTNLKVKTPPIKQYVPSMPGPISELVERMMEKDAGQRVPSMDQLIEAMRRQLTAKPQVASPVAKPTKTAVGDKTAALPKRNKVLLIVTGMIIFWSIVGIGYVVLTGKEKAAVEDKLADAARADYRVATSAFIERKYAESAGLFRKLLENHPQKLDIKVPISGDRPSTLKQAAEGHLLYCDAHAAFVMKDYDKALQLVFKAADANVVAASEVDALQRDAERLRGISATINAIVAEMNKENFFGAKRMLLDFRATDTYKGLSEAEKESADQLDLQITARKEAKESETIIEVARNLAVVDRQKAIEHLNAWLEEKGGTNRTVEVVRDAYVAAQEFELTLQQGKSAEQNMSWAEAIAAYNKALSLNRLEAEKQDLPTRIRKIRGKVLLDLGKAAYETEKATGDFSETIRLVNDALNEDPTLAEAKDILARIGSKGEMDRLEREAVGAYARKEYEKVIIIWTRLGEDFKADPVKVAAEIEKAKFQILLDKMELAWTSGNEQEIIAACDAVLRIEPGNERALLLKTLVTTRRRFYDQLAVGEKHAAKGEYGDAKLAIRRAREIAETISDAAIRDQLVREANARASEVEYTDNFSKARRDFENGKCKEAYGWIGGALKEKKTDEARELYKKITECLDKKAKEASQ
ncbi:MAG: serine/threonine-protein kinase [Phycisphaeraceae bacterium]